MRILAIALFLFISSWGSSAFAATEAEFVETIHGKLDAPETAFDQLVDRHFRYELKEIAKQLSSEDRDWVLEFFEKFEVIEAKKRWLLPDFFILGGADQKKEIVGLYPGLMSKGYGRVTMIHELTHIFDFLSEYNTDRSVRFYLDRWYDRHRTRRLETRAFKNEFKFMKAVSFYPEFSKLFAEEKRHFENIRDSLGYFDEWAQSTGIYRFSDVKNGMGVDHYISRNLRLYSRRIYWEHGKYMFKILIPGAMILDTCQYLLGG